jgi:hypothetical protein
MQDLAAGRPESGGFARLLLDCRQKPTETNGFFGGFVWFS